MINLKLLSIVLLSIYVISARMSYLNHNNETPSPLVIVPGDGGSRAYAYVDYYIFTIKRLIWVNYIYMVFPNALTDYFKLIYDPDTHTTTNVDNTRVLFPGWGSTEMIEELDESRHFSTTYFAPLVKELINDKFYVRNKTLRGAPFDFRKAPNENDEFVNNLQLLIEDTYKQSGNQRIVLLGHSMGSLYSLFFLKKMSLNWKKKFLRTFISVSGPLGGAVKALKLETTGDSLGSPRCPLSFREMQRSLPSSAFLLPKASVFGNMSLIKTPSRVYSANDYVTLFNDMDYRFGAMMYNDTKNLVDGSKGPEGIDEVHCIYSYGLDTYEQLVFTSFPDSIPKYVSGDGDSTVNIQSLEMCKQWPNSKVFTITKADHMKIVGNPLFISKLKEILYK